MSRVVRDKKKYSGHITNNKPETVFKNLKPPIILRKYSKVKVEVKVGEKRKSKK
jgi:hypothetical protein